MHKASLALAAKELVDERLRLARNLHDTVAQSLASVGFALDEIIGRKSISPEDRKLVRGARTQIIQIIDRLRDEIHALRQFENYSLEKWIKEEIKIPITYSLNSLGQQNAEHFENLAYLAIELINNAIKHQGGHHFHITETENSLEITFDTVEGTSNLASHGSRSFGLLGITERVQEISGELIQSDKKFIIKW